MAGGPRAKAPKKAPGHSGGEGGPPQVEPRAPVPDGLDPIVARVAEVREREAGGPKVRPSLRNRPGRRYQR